MKVLNANETDAVNGGAVVALFALLCFVAANASNIEDAVNGALGNPMPE